MLRFVRAPDGVLTPDLAGKLPGTALWVETRREIVAQLAAQDTTPPALPELVERLLRQRLHGLLGLAKKAGAIVAGFAKVEAALARGELFVLLAAADGAEDGRKKLAHKAARHNVALVDILTSDELGMAFGRANVIHAGATNAGWAAQIVSEAQRLAAFLSSPDGMDRSEDA